MSNHDREAKYQVRLVQDSNNRTWSGRATFRAGLELIWQNVPNVPIISGETLEEAQAEALRVIANLVAWDKGHDETVHTITDLDLT